MARQSAESSDTTVNTNSAERTTSDKPNAAADHASGNGKSAPKSQDASSGGAAPAKQPNEKKTPRRRRRKVKAARPASAEGNATGAVGDGRSQSSSQSKDSGAALADRAAAEKPATPKAADTEHKSTDRRRRRKRRKATAQPAPSDAAEAKPAQQNAPPATKPASDAAAAGKVPVSTVSFIRHSLEPFGAGIVMEEAKQEANVSAAVASTGQGAAKTADDKTPAAKSPEPAEQRRPRRRRRKTAAKKAEQAEPKPGTTAPAPADRKQPPADTKRAPAAASAPAPKTTNTAEAAPPTSAPASDAAAKLVLKKRPKRRGRRKKSRERGEEHVGEAVPGTEAARTPTPAAKPTDQKKEKEAAARASQAPAAEPAKKKPDRARSRKRKRAAKATAAEAPSQAGPDFIDAKSPAKPPVLARELIINVTAGAECRIAILQEGRLEELYIERQSAESHVGNIYKGVVTNVEPSIQAAFVDFGLTKNGFLHISDVQPRYFPGKMDQREQVGKKVPRRDRPPIQKCFRRGDEVIVQVAKEGVGTKGPTLTTYISIPGRFMVMMPGMNRLGVSRKIEDESDRKAMRDLLAELSLPADMGFILRTAGLNRTKRELQGDLNYLNRLWKTVENQIENVPPPCELYRESDLVIRTIRDVYSSDFTQIVVDDAETTEKARDFLQIAMPRSPGKVVEYRRTEPIFHYYNIENEINQIHARHVPLPSGGSIVIDSTEAMVAIDVNSGKYRDPSDAEETAFRINLEAAEEIARQLRLRDLGGLVVCDFIDMRLDRHKRAVEKALREALKKHKERARTLRMSKFGLIEMTRQRQRPSIKRSIFNDCPHCNGTGLIKTPESVSLEVMRILQLLIYRPEVSAITMSVAPAVGSLVLNQRRAILHQLEQTTGKKISIHVDATFARDQVSYECADDRDMPLRIEV